MVTISRHRPTDMPTFSHLLEEDSVKQRAHRTQHRGIDVYNMSDVTVCFDARIVMSFAVPNL